MTEEINVENVIRELARRYPAVFVADQWRPHRPLMLGTHQALLEACPDLAGAIWLALNRYTSRLLYQQALVESAWRVDLAGKPVGTVSAAHAAKAAAKVARVLAAREAPPVIRSPQESQAKQKHTRLRRMRGTQIIGDRSEISLVGVKQ
jgi:sRNA-binding protein